MTKQEALDWFVHRKESIALSDRCQEAENVAIEAIQKAIPKPPKVDYQIYPRPLYFCPDCGFGVAWCEQWRCKVCPECGQTIDWRGFPPEKPPEDWPSYMGRYDWRLIDMWKHEKEEDHDRETDTV